MGAARLLAKGWIVFCLFAGAHAVHSMLAAGGWGFLPQVRWIVGAVLLFMAMGILFAGGFGASSGAGMSAWLKSLRTTSLVPDFDDWVFSGFVLLSFLNQILYAPDHVSGGMFKAVEEFIRYVVPGQLALETAMEPCSLDGGRWFSSSVAWLIAFIYLASASSRVKLRAGLLRLERAHSPESLGPTLLAATLGVVAIIGIQLLYIGSAYAWLPCAAFADITGATLAGLAPLMLAYLIVSAFVALLASGPEPASD